MVLVLSGASLFLMGVVVSCMMPMMGDDEDGRQERPWHDGPEAHEGDDAADDGRDVAARHQAPRSSGTRKPRSDIAEHLLLSMSQSSQRQELVSAPEW